MEKFFLAPSTTLFRSDNNPKGLESLLQAKIHTLFGKGFRLIDLSPDTIVIDIPKEIPLAEIQKHAELLNQAGISTTIRPPILTVDSIYTKLDIRGETLESLNEKVTVLIKAKDSAPCCCIIKRL